MLARGVLAAAGLALLAAASPANATPIGPNCLTCQGSIYELTYSGSPISSTPTTQTFEVTLTINPTNFTPSGTNPAPPYFIEAVAPKVTSMENSVTLVNAPGVLGNWTTVNGGINAAGCSMAGAGFVCAEDATPPSKVPLGDAPVPFAGTYTWVFDLTIPTGTLLTDANAASIKVHYSDSKGNKVGALVSEPITLEIIPEPSTLLLVGVGLALLTKRRQSTAQHC